MYLLFENMEKFKYLGETLANTNDIHKEIKQRINMGNKGKGIPITGHEGP